MTTAKVEAGKYDINPIKKCYLIDKNYNYNK